MVSSALTRWIPSTLATQAFLAITLLEATVDIGIEAIIFTKGEFQHSLFDASDEKAALPVYLAIFTAAQ